MTTSTEPFFVKTCSLAAIATGQRASSLLELRDRIASIEASSIYFHFWGGHMYPQFAHTQHHNDFSNWVYHRLHDNALSEQLSVIDPTEFENLEELRQEVLETIEKRLDDYEIIFWTMKEDQFHFIDSTIVVFDSSLNISNPEDLPNVIPMLPPSSIFYHFIDARTRTPDKVDDFSTWLKVFGNKYDSLIEKIQSIDPYFLSLTEFRDELAKVLQNYFEKRVDNG